MRHARTLRVGLSLLVGTAAISSFGGCTHNYYYGGATPVAGCPPTTTFGPSTFQNGAVCEVPSQVDGSRGTVVASSPAPAVSSPLLGGGPRPPRVVLSEPNPGPRLAWRRADPESSLATTRVEGDLKDDATLTK